MSSNPLSTSSIPPLPPDSSGNVPAIAKLANAETQSARGDKFALELEELKERNLALADAVVNSAEIIEELEQTKLKLAEAQKAAEQAHQNTQMMAETIFEETHDAMIVMDENLSFVSANWNAREIFQIDGAAERREVLEVIKQRYHSIDHRDWTKALLSDSNQTRLELYRVEACSPNKSQRNSQNLEQDSILEKHWIQISISPLRNNLAEAKFLLTAHDITQRKQIEDQFQHQALHDNVTGLPNRRYFVRKIEALLSSSGPDNVNPFAVCFLDLDNFKTVNDTLGHEAGDQLLIQVAQRIKNTTRKDCFLARFGGDEFALLIADHSPMEESAICKRIVSELRKPFTINENSVYIGASIGMTRYPEDAQDVNSLMQNADVAMYSAKDGGRNCFHPFTRELAKGIKERQSLLEDLRLALEKKDIALEYQPKWCLRTNKLAGCEALLRWRRNGMSVSPSHLIEAAECSGLILPLGDLIIETAVRQTAQWTKSLALNGRMAINLSPRQLSDRGFTARFQKIIDNAGIGAESIEFEITETAMIENFDQAFQRIQELKEIGVAISIDDFGTGYSSLSYLKSFPVSTLKIDRSFISDLPDDSKTVAVAEAILSLGHGLGLSVVAEGVETESQRQFLDQAGCDIIQGYLLSKSLTPRAFEEWVRAVQN